MSGVDRLTNMSLDRHTPHNYEQALLGKNVKDGKKDQAPTFYDCQPFYPSTRREDANVPMFKLGSPRKIGGGYGGYYKVPQDTTNPRGPETSVDLEASMNASISKLSHRKRSDIGLVEAKRMISRNRKPMETEVVKDLGANILLENTREDRLREMHFKRE